MDGVIGVGARRMFEGSMDASELSMEDSISFTGPAWSNRVSPSGGSVVKCGTKQSRAIIRSDSSTIGVVC